MISPQDFCQYRGFPLKLEEAKCPHYIYVQSWEFGARQTLNLLRN